MIKGRKKVHKQQHRAASRRAEGEVEGTSPETRRKRPGGAGCHQVEASGGGHAMGAQVQCGALFWPLFMALLCMASLAGASTPSSGLRFDPDSNSYSGLTFTFDPRLDKRVEWLHFDHWLSIMQQSSSLLYEALNGRAHLAEVRVLIPYKWRHLEWPVIHKPGVPIIMNRRLRYADSDIIVGFEDPVYKETPFAIQHDECARPGLNIHMPISFLEQRQLLEPKLKARQLVRELAAHRYGIFKESGFRSDPMYPPFASLPGLAGTQSAGTLQAGAGRTQQRAQQLTGSNRSSAAHWTVQQQQQQVGVQLDEQQTTQANLSQPDSLLAGFDEHWNECAFETQPGSGLPTVQALHCAPYLARASSGQVRAPSSLNLMSADPFSHVELGARGEQAAARLANQAAPLEWRDLADSVRWHFCGDNFPFSPLSSALMLESGAASGSGATSNEPPNGRPANQMSQVGARSFLHNQLATNKQNVMCNERSALDVIKSHEDFRRAPFSPSTFNRLPATNFRFLQEMPPRLILCVEYSAHLYQARRLDHGILEAAIAKFLAYDLIADTELALVLFAQQQATRSTFRRLDTSLEARLALYNPPIDPFEESPRLYSEQELAQLDIQAASSQAAKLIKGTCSLAKALAEANALLQQQRAQYDDVGADIVMLTSGLFIEDEAKIEELLRALFQRQQTTTAGGASGSEPQLQLNLIIYPSNLLFDTKSGDGFVVLDALESDSILRARINKLLLIQRLANAKIHLVKEHLDANGDVKMSTLVQFNQIFDHLARGHSWDQTHSMILLAQQPVEARPVIGGRGSPGGAMNGSRLSFQFELDGSIQNELIVGFIEPRQRLHHRSGKRFSIRSLQLRSPGGHLLLTDTHPFAGSGDELGAATVPQPDEPAGELAPTTAGNEGEFSAPASNWAEPAPPGGGRTTQSESALFPYRSQLGLAGFHLKPAHLAQLNGSRSGGGRLSGLWTLTAITDEPLQTSGIAMARVNPAGDTITANCWIQVYRGGQETHQSGNEPGAVQAVKVFAQTRAGPRSGPLQEVVARMEVQDELGNIVQNVNMLDDGLGAPDITGGDGVHSQYVQKAHRPGFYRVLVELTGGPQSGAHRPRESAPATAAVGQDNPCCGSFVPSQHKLAPDTRHLSRQLYCGTFHLESNNRLAQQRPPRVNNLTVVAVDQDNRRVTIRWFEPSMDISVPVPLAARISAAITDSNDLEVAQAEALVRPQRTGGGPGEARLLTPRAPSSEEEPAANENDPSENSYGGGQQQQRGSYARTLANKQAAMAPSSGEPQPALGNRYEIKLFADRDAIKRSFDAKHEVGFKFNQWNVEGTFPNASAYGGLKEVTLRIPNGREGVYYIAMKVYNNLGTGSAMSNIVHFWMRNNLSVEEAESLYGPGATTVDAEGNVYDKNGELIQRSASGQLNYSLLRGTGSSGLGSGLSVLVFISVLAFILSIVCIGLVACLASSARRSLNSRRKTKSTGLDGPGGKGGKSKASGSGGTSKVASTSSSAILAAGGSGSSMVSSGCGSSQQSELASSVSGASQSSEGSPNGHQNLSDGTDMMLASKLGLCSPEDSHNHHHRQQQITYGNLQLQQQHQQHQAQLIQRAHALMLPAAHSDGRQQGDYMQPYQQQHYADFYQQNQQSEGSLGAQDGATGDADKANPWLQHTMINGYAYATVNGGQQQHLVQQQPDGLATKGPGANPGDLNENGLGAATMSPVQSWPADILLSHYDKVKQARERNEAPPVMRIETLEHEAQFAEGLPMAPMVASNSNGEQNNGDKQSVASYLVRQQRHQAPSYFNQQLQQQLSSVLRNKQQRNLQLDQEHQQTLDKSSPALEGLTDLHEPESSISGASYHLDQVAPPPQYVYCTSNEASGLVAPIATEPSIYSQVTNLQQVPSASGGQGNGNSDNSYYANQWPPPIAANDVYQANVRGVAGGLDEYIEKANGIANSAAISEV